MYFLPLLVLSFTLPSLSMIVNNNTESSEIEIPTLASVGLIIPYTIDIIYYAHLGAKLAFESYNDMWGDGSTSYNEPIGITTKLNNYATVSNLKTQLTYRDRVQVTSHGSMTNVGPEIDLYGSVDLAPDTSAWWRSPYGQCQFIFLASCYSMGDGDMNTALVTAIKDNTDVKNVIGFNGAVDVVAALLLGMNFWYKHIAGRRTSTDYGGYSVAASFGAAASLLESLIHDIEVTIHAIEIASIVGMLFAVLYEGAAFVASDLLTALFHELWPDGVITLSALAVLRMWLEHSLDAFTLVTDGEYVSSMTPIGEGAGGGWGYKVITTD
ncbi:MAG: hypothetical protein ACTSV2_17430 [Candidatus Thorarchaeota archaeon]